MKFNLLYAAAIALALMAMASFAAAQPVAPVPNLINFQGRLTDNTGNPVTDGAHSVMFSIFSVRTGGVALWSETQNPNTTGGLFTTQLGLVTTLPPDLFESNDSLFLELVADGQTISPRSFISATPSSRVSNAIDCKSTFSGTTYLKNFNLGDGLQTYGADGVNRSWLYGASWGELFLFNSTGSHDLDASLGANNTGGSPGGELTLRNGGALQIDLNAGNAGDASVLLPTDAIDSREILDEPGIASSFPNNSTLLTGITTAYDSVKINAPTAGFIVVFGYEQPTFNHTNGTADIARFYISSTAGLAEFNNLAIVTYPAVAATGLAYTTCSNTKVEAVSAGLHTYYLNADMAIGSASLARPRLTAMFFPTNYGTVVSTIAAQPAGGGNVAASVDPAGTSQPSDVQVTTVADHNAQLETEYAKQIADLETRIKALEGKQNLAQPAGAIRPR